MKLNFTIAGVSESERPLQEIRSVLYVLMARLESLAWEYRNENLGERLDFSVSAEKAWMDIALERVRDGN